LEFIIGDYGVDGDTALKMFYESHIGACYSDDETGLYGESALYVYSLFQEEQKASAAIFGKNV
jgi:hypothetical protein